MARVYVDQKDPIRAARLLGATQRIMGEQLAIPATVRPFYEQTVQAARERWGRKRSRLPVTKVRE